MKLGFIYGMACSNGPFDVRGLYQTRGLTGSESFFWNTIKGLAELGHDVTAFCETAEEFPDGADNIAGAKVKSLASLDIDRFRYDAVMSWNEPDYLRMCKQGTLRVCAQQLNDFGYCGQGFDSSVDIYVSPSRNHGRHLGRTGIDLRKIECIPNCINTEFYENQPAAESRAGHMVVYCSSPDRGLHHLLEMWPLVRARVPDATLRIFYTIHRWLAHFDKRYFGAGTMIHQLAKRAHLIRSQLETLGMNGENGVFVVGPKSNVEMAEELKQARVLAYPCDTVRYTEGFSVSILDGCAAGAVPIISDCDAIGEVYETAAHVIRGKPADHKAEWVDAIVKGLTDEPFRKAATKRAVAFATKQSRQIRARQWEKLLVSRVIAHGLQTRSIHFKGKTFKIAYQNYVEAHPSWYSFEDEVSVRESKWNIKPGDIVLDVGAAYGSYALSALALGAEHAFAWSPERFPGDDYSEQDYLLESAKQNGWETRISVYPEGMFDRSGFIHTVTQEFTSAPPAEPNGNVIKVSTIDDWADVNFWAKYPKHLERNRVFMKLDVEGAEAHVLKGADKFIRAIRPHVLVENHLFKNPGIEEEVRRLMIDTFGYREISTTPYHTVSHSLYEPA